VASFDVLQARNSTGEDSDMLRNKIVKTVVMMAMVLATLLMSSVMAMADSDQYPKIVPLPNGWRPEGIVVGRGHTLYTGSLGTGAIYRADLKSGAGDVLVPPQAGRVAVGLSYDSRSHLIFAAGGPGGAGYVYDAASGAGDDSRDPLLKALEGATGSTVTNADGSTTTSLTYGDGSTVTMTKPAASSASTAATSSYNFLEQLIQRQANAIAARTSSSLSVSV
jgi:hypothetical protein